MAENDHSPGGLKGLLRSKMKGQPDNPGEYRDLGFGTKAIEDSRRLLNADGTFNVKRKGLSRFRSLDIYHTLISMSWIKFSVLVMASYLVMNVIFALFYMAAGLQHLAGIIGNSIFERFEEAFFFSAQTLTTVGYGRISPVGASASSIAAIESMIGLMGFALVTGLLYGRFSRPRAKILYSNVAVVAPYRGGRGFMFRIANLRSTQLIELEVQVVLSILKPDRKSRSFDTIHLERSSINFLALSWTIVHPMDEQSSLFGMTEEEFRNSDAEFVVLLKGFDDTFSQTVYSRTSYKPSEIRWGAKFKSIISGEGGMAVLNLDRINDTEPAELPQWEAKGEQA